jgi:hypothetical protein
MEYSLDGPLPKLCPAVTLSHQDGHHSAVALLLKAALIQVRDYRLLGSSGYLYSVQISNVATWSGLNFKTNVEVVLFKWENVIKTIWWLSVTSIAWGNHLGSLSYRQLVSMFCVMQLFHLVLHPPWSIDHFQNIEIHCLSENISGVS